MPPSNCSCLGTQVSKIHGMIDAHAHINSLDTWPKQLLHVHISEITNSNAFNRKIIVNGQDILHHLTEIIGSHLVDLNTHMYNYYNNNNREKMTNRYIPSLMIVSTIDMDMAHIKGYEGVFIKHTDHDEKLCYQHWYTQVENTEIAVAGNSLRLFPLFSYDPRRYRLPDKELPGENGCEQWDIPFASIVGHGHTNSKFKKYWIGFSMDPTLGFRPFDEFCEHLPAFYKECQDKEIPILAHCVPGGITTHDAKSEEYKNFNKKKRRDRIKKGNERHKEYCTDNYYGRERVIDDDNLNYFYMNQGHPRNWIPALEHCPELRLCLAGFGGNREWQLADWAGIHAPYPNREWIRCIIKLTAKYDYVYADISGLNIFDGKVNKGLRQILGLIKDDHEKFKHLKYKLIFGSDWYFTALTGGIYNKVENSYAVYCNELKKLFYEFDKSGKLWERVSLINPWNFYGLSADKIKKIYYELSKDKKRVNNEMLKKVMDWFDGTATIKARLPKYIASRNEEDPFRGVQKPKEDDDDLAADYDYLFIDKDFERLKDLVDENAWKIREFKRINKRRILRTDYGYKPGDMYNCITLVNRGLLVLLLNPEISKLTLNNMDQHMLGLVGLGYAEEGIEIKFKILKGNRPSNQKYDSVDYENETLSKTVMDLVGLKEGYYVFGISIMDGVHSVILAAKATQGKSIEFDIFDQSGPWSGHTNRYWLSAEHVDVSLRDYISQRSPLESGDEGKITTKLYQVRKRMRWDQ